MENSQTPTQIPSARPAEDYVFKFLSYYYDKRSRTATFCYQGIDNFIFAEKVTFAENPNSDQRFNILDDPLLDKLLDRAMFLAFIIIGTSYFKSHPTPYVRLDIPIDDFQAAFFNKIYQEGLSQFAFENHLTRNNLAHFTPTANYTAPQPIPYKGSGILSLQSGGKDSLLVSTLLNERNISYTPWYLTSNPDGEHPTVIDNLSDDLTHLKASVAVREIDLDHLQQSGGFNGHVPITYIVESLALIQAIINNQSVVITSIGQEGTEPHALIGDLPINHQWSKTWEAELLLAKYVDRYISPNLHVGSPIRRWSELRVAELFVKKCWLKFGYVFSSCNEANYHQGAQNSALHWCGNCAKCANTYLLFCPFLYPSDLQPIFADQDLFANPNLEKTFKGLLGVGKVMKPFECVGSIDELRLAYHSRVLLDWQKNPALLKQMKDSKQPFPIHYETLPFAVPQSNFNYLAEYPEQEFFKNLIPDEPTEQAPATPPPTAPTA